MAGRSHPAEGWDLERAVVEGMRQAAADQAAGALAEVAGQRQVVAAAGQGLAAPTVAAVAAATVLVADCHRCSSWCHLNATRRRSPWGSHQCFALCHQMFLCPGLSLKKPVTRRRKPQNAHDEAPPIALTARSPDDKPSLTAHE